MRQIRPHDLPWIVAATGLILIFLSSCRTNSQLRGSEVLYLRLPRYTTQEDSITLTNDHVASRSFIPVTVHTDINRVIVPDSLWNELEQMRLGWCHQPPSFASATASDTRYDIVFKCDWAEDAEYFVEVRDLPLPLQRLTDLVPSTSEHVLTQ